MNCDTKCSFSHCQANTPAMSSSHRLLDVGYPNIGFREELWDPGQEWIQIFDNLLKHPQGVKRGCSCDICCLGKSPASPACPLSPRLSLHTDLSRTSRRRSKGYDNISGELFHTYAPSHDSNSKCFNYLSTHCPSLCVRQA